MPAEQKQTFFSSLADSCSTCCCENDTEKFYSNEQLTDEYFAIIDQLSGDIAGRRAAHNYMQHSTAIVHDVVVDSTFAPKLYNEASYQLMKGASESMHRILQKVMQHYLDEPAYRDVFDYEERLQRLILLPRGYDALLPFARLDSFLDENTGLLRFCEFNGDGSSGMNENREISVSIAGSDTFKTFAGKHHIECCELFQSWVNCFIDIYQSYKHKVDNPSMAIVDYLENGVVNEFAIFARLFTQAGFPCHIVDVREMSYDGKHLYDKDGQVIDVIWRRCVTNDVIEHWDESQALIEAVADENVALIGSFAGHIVHDKQIFKALFDSRTQAILSDEENFLIQSTIPFTAFLTSDVIVRTDAMHTKDQWIIKPTDHYAADHVYAGCAVSQDEWENLLATYCDSKAGFPFILQAYIEPFKTKTLPPDSAIDTLDDEQVSKEAVSWNNLNGMYVYNGEFTGVFSRLGPLPTISKDKKGITAATIWVWD